MQEPDTDLNLKSCKAPGCRTRFSHARGTEQLCEIHLKRKADRKEQAENRVVNLEEDLNLEQLITDDFHGEDVEEQEQPTQQPVKAETIVGIPDVHFCLHFHNQSLMFTGSKKDIHVCKHKDQKFVDKLRGTRSNFCSNCGARMRRNNKKK